MPDSDPVVILDAGASSSRVLAGVPRRLKCSYCGTNTECYVKSTLRRVGRVCDLWVGWEPACEYAGEDGVVDDAKSTPRLSSSKKNSFPLSNVLCPALTYPPARSVPEAMQRVNLLPPSSARSHSLRVAFLGAPLSIETRNVSAFLPLPFPTKQRSAKVPADRRSDAQYSRPFHQPPRVRAQILNTDLVTRNPCDSPAFRLGRFISLRVSCCCITYDDLHPLANF